MLQEDYKTEYKFILDENDITAENGSDRSDYFAFFYVIIFIFLAAEIVK